MRCVGVASVKLQLTTGAETVTEALVVREKPRDFDVILGMNAITAFHGVTVRQYHQNQYHHTKTHQRHQISLIATAFIALRPRHYTTRHRTLTHVDDHAFE